MRLANAILLILAAMIVTAMATIAIYNGYSLVQLTEMKTDINVTNENKIGFNLDKDALHFGRVPGGGYGERMLEINNTFGYAVRVKVYATGGMKDLVSADPGNFRLGAGEGRLVLLKADAPRTTAKTDYSGTIVIEIRKASLFW
jgi:hypothetical protein